MSDESKERSRGAAEAHDTTFRTTVRKQTGCCDEAQADGIPCPHPSCDCETCAQSRLRDGGSPS